MENQHLKSHNQHLVEQVGALQDALEGRQARVCRCAVGVCGGYGAELQELSM